MKASTILLIAFLVATASTSFATRTEPTSKEKSHHKGGGSNGGGNAGGGPGGGFFPPGFDIPGFGNGWSGGYGGGYGGPSGGYSKGGIIRPTVVCTEKGPCFNKKLICPAKCFKSFSKSGKNYGGGGGGGGCTMDCKKNCVAYC